MYTLLLRIIRASTNLYCGKHNKFINKTRSTTLHDFRFVKVPRKIISQQQQSTPGISTAARGLESMCSPPHVP